MAATTAKGKTAAAKKSVRYVFVPADMNESLQERTLTFDAANEVGAMGEHVRQHFSAQALSAARNAKLRDSLRDQIKAKIPPGTAVTEQLIDQFAAMSPFDMLPLLQHSKESGYEGVNMYVDDQAVAKGLGHNPRASAICSACGNPTNVMGDVFIARIRDDDADLFERHDFTLADLSAPSAGAAAANGANAAAPAAAASASGSAAASTAASAPASASASASGSTPSSALPVWMAKAREWNARKQAKGKADANAQIKGLLSSASRPKSCGAAGCAGVGTNRCSRCKAQWYCSEHCQRNDWSRHKVKCKAKKTAAKPAAAAAAAGAAAGAAAAQPTAATAATDSTAAAAATVASDSSAKPNAAKGVDK